MSAPTVPPADAPAPPRRSVGTRLIGLLGELMVIAGALIGLYVVWELFYTDVAANREQTEVLQDLDWAQTEPITADAADPDAPQVIPDELKQDPSTAPVMDEPSFTTTFATMWVPRWGADYIKPISQGTTRRDVLDTLGIGHYEGTAMPGGLGNFAISAHRTTYGKPFSRIDELQAGDALVVQTADAWYVYRVTSHDIVLPSAVEVIAPVPNNPGAAPDNRYITLTSCHPRFSASHRYIVWGELEYWAPVEAGVPAEIVEEAS